MVICPQCNIEHAPREEFCRKCGKFLLSVEDPVPKEEKIEGNLICPKCQVLYEKGNYCRRCGSLLVQSTPTQEANVQPLEKKGVKRRSKEWLSLFKEKKEIESCMSKLEAQEDRISSDVIHPMLAHYRDRLNSLLPVLQEIEAELESIGEKTSEEIDFFESKLKPVQKRLEEFQSLYGSGAVMKADFLREKNELRKEIKSIERSLVTFRKILSLLPDRMSGNMVSSGSTGHLLQPATLAAATVIILLVMAGAGLLWQRHAQSTRPILTEVITSPSPSPTNLQTMMDSKESEKIGALFENIRKANLQKNIGLFMACFSRDFDGMEGKRQDTLNTWKTYNYHDLSYALKEQEISGDTANVRLEWLIRTSKKAGGKLHAGRSVLDVTLKRENGLWKIQAIKPVS